MTFHPGDRVRLTQGSLGRNVNAGAEGVVTFVPARGPWVGVKFDADPLERTPSPRRLEKIMSFKKGDRVRYTGAHMPGLAAPSTIGMLGTVERAESHPIIQWDGPGVTPGNAVFPGNIELVENTNMIDVTKPLQISGTRGYAGSVLFVTETSDGHILVDTSKLDTNSDWMIFDKTGAMVRCQSQHPSASTLRLRNKPEVKTIYNLVFPDGSARSQPGLATLGEARAQRERMSSNPEILAVTTENGKITKIEHIQ